MQQKFRSNCFFKLVDVTITSFQQNFEMYQTHGEIFGLLYDINKLNVTDEPNILKSYKDIYVALEKYLDRIDLFEELKMLNTINNNLS